MTTCKGAADAKHGVIQLTDVKIANEIHNTDLVRNSAIFICGNPGLYLISVYIQTNNKHGDYYVYKNNNVMAYGYSSITDYGQTTSVTVI